MNRLVAVLALTSSLAAALPGEEPMEVQEQPPRSVAIILSDLEFLGGAAAVAELESSFRRAASATGVFDLAPGAARDGSPRWHVRCVLEEGVGSEVTGHLSVTEPATGRQVLSEMRRGTPRALGHFFVDALHSYARDSPPVFAAPMAAVRGEDGRHEIVVAEWDGSAARAVHVENGPLLLHDWHPDGKRLAFTTWRSGKPEIWLVDVYAGVTRPLVDDGELATGAAFSPDGTQLAFVSATGGDVDLYLARADGTRARRLTSDRAVESSPSWSSDATRIAFVSSRRGKPHAYVMNADGSGVSPVASGLVEVQAVRFAPLGDLLSVVGRGPDGEWGVYTVSELGGDLVLVSRASRSVPAASWAPDGELLAYVTDGHPLEVVSSDGAHRTQTDVAGLEGVAWRAYRR